MVKIMVYYIAKNKDMSDTLCEEFKALSLGFGVKLDFINLFSKSINEGKKQDSQDAQKYNTKEFLKELKNQQCKIDLYSNGKRVDSFAFSKL